jgi:hypothetical protein
MKGLYRKILREFALRFCKLYAIEQRRAASLEVQLMTTTNQDRAQRKNLFHLQNAVAAETLIREIVIERTNELYNKYNLKSTSANEQDQTRRDAAEH